MEVFRSARVAAERVLLPSIGVEHDPHSVPVGPGVQLQRATAARIVIGRLHRRRQPIILIPAGNEDTGNDGVLGVGWLAGRVQLDLQRMVVSWTP